MSRQRRKVAGAFRYTGGVRGSYCGAFLSHTSTLYILLAAKRSHKEQRREMVTREQEFHSDSALY